ncbi:MAG: aspartate-semialdehyde dehydrogenase [Bacteroidetes bacterium]|nr:aspartate-semialdehyde dehydrogenase [Bacteroidota bacterium]
MKHKVAVLGATGAVGQRFIQLLENHPDFEVHELVASSRSAGKPYSEAAKWKLATALPEGIKQKIVKSTDDALESKILFSGLDSDIAGTAEEAYRAKGHIVISNSKNHRMDEDVPLVVPEINPEHLDMVIAQKKKYGGAIVTNPNCSTIGLVLGIAPVFNLGIDMMIVSTMQAISGAGYPGIPSFDVLDNVIPHIGGEEDKIEDEPNKIFGKFDGKGIVPAPTRISAMVHRVPAIDGHLEAVSIKFKKSVTRDEIVSLMKNYEGEPQKLNCPSAPKPAIQYFEAVDRPQTRLDRDLGKGMTVSVGNLRPCNIFDWKFNLLVHNTVRGAAGGTILIAELMLRKGLI